jgi:pantothenate kinase
VNGTDRGQPRNPLPLCATLVDGYLALLRRVRGPDDGIVYAPRFDRTREASLAGSIAVATRHQLILTEGNYLLLDRPGWRQVRSLLDEVWLLDVEPALRRARLLQRQISFGEATDDALDWIRGFDDANAELIESTRDRADLAGTLVRSAAQPSTSHATAELPNGDAGQPIRIRSKHQVGAAPKT